MKSRLFSDDGIDASHARREPDSIYFPDENTQSEIKLLFTTLKSAQNESENGVSVNISELPFSADLAMLAQGNLLSIDDVRTYCFISFTEAYYSDFLIAGDQWYVLCCNTFHVAESTYTGSSECLSTLQAGSRRSHAQWDGVVSERTSAGERPDPTQ